MSIFKEEQVMHAETEEILKGKEKARHAKYYQKNKKKIDRKQKKADELRDRQTYSHEYYLKNKEKMNQYSHDLYQKQRPERLAYAKAYYELHKEEINRKRKEKRDAMLAEKRAKK
jgi:hypothetical protein